MLGMAGRYMSIDSGAVADSNASVSSITVGMGRAVEDEESDTTMIVPTTIRRRSGRGTGKRNRSPKVARRRNLVTRCAARTTSSPPPGAASVARGPGTEGIVGAMDPTRPAYHPVRAAEVVADFGDHLRYERGRSEHTVRAYCGDVTALLGTDTDDDGMVDLAAALTLDRLRGWLAAQADGGIARTTLSRRTSAVRTFGAWALRTGLIAQDPAH